MGTELTLDADRRERLREAVDRLVRSERPRYRRLWAYFKNPMRACGSEAADAPASERPYRQAQEWGLPPRITGICSGVEPFSDTRQACGSRKEVVIENDIGWRIDTMVNLIPVLGKAVFGRSGSLIRGIRAAFRERDRLRRQRGHYLKTRIGAPRNRLAKGENTGGE